MPSINIDLLRSVEWGRTYLWDFVIDDRDFPFDWVPAIDVEETSSIVESETISGGQTNFKFPKNTGVKEVKITFIDDINHKIYSYFENWLNIVTMNDDMYVSTLEDCCRLIQIKRLANDRTKTLKQSIYWVYPEGALTYNGNSESGLLQYSMSLIVAGTTSKSRITIPKATPNTVSYEQVTLKELIG